MRAILSTLQSIHPADAAALQEVSSYDTVGNAYFSLTIHALPSGWRRLAVVTSHFHMPRSRALFADLYQLAGSSLFNDPYWWVSHAAYQIVAVLSVTTC